jgi:hypothetical protein
MQRSTRLVTNPLLIALISAAVAASPGLPAAAAAPASLTVSGVQVTGWTGHSVGLSWSAPDAGAWTYWVRANGMTPEAQVIGTPSGVRANVLLPAAGGYTLQVVALGPANRRAESRPVTVDSRLPYRDTTAPAAPTGVQAAWTSATTATLGWTHASDNTGAVVNYEVSADGGQTWLRAYRGRVPSHATPRYTALGLPPGTANRLGVRTVDAANHASSPVFVTAVTAAAADRVPPSRPANLGTGPSSAGTVLSWQPATDGAAPVARYSLSYADDPRLGLSSALLLNFAATPGRTQLRVADLVAACALAPGRYTVNLRAFDATGNVSPPSNTITVVV